MLSKVAVFHRGGAVLWTSDEDNANGNTADESENHAQPLASDTYTPMTADAPSSSSSSACYLAINKLIQTVLLSDKAGSDSLVHDAFTLKWTFANDVDLVFVAVYFSFQKLLHVADLLHLLKAEFVKMFHDSLQGGITNLTARDYSCFYAQWRRIQKYYRTQRGRNKGPKDWADTEHGQQHELYTVGGATNKKNKNKSSSKANTGNDDDDDADAADGSRKRGITFGRKASKGPRAFDPSKHLKGAKSARNVAGKNGKNKKNKRKKGKGKGRQAQLKSHWSENNVTAFNKKRLSQRDMDELNMCKEDEGDADNGDAQGETYNGYRVGGQCLRKGEVCIIRAIHRETLPPSLTVSLLSDPSREINTEFDCVTKLGGGTVGESQTLWTPDGAANLEESDSDSLSSDDDFSDLAVPERDQNAQSVSGGIWSKLTGLIGTKPLTENDVSGVLQELERSLSSKNVANVIAKELCDSIKESLVGQKLGSFSTVRSVVKAAMTESLQRILTPTRPINLLHGIKTAQDEQRPFTIVFVGVNGVGKSTSLSKVIHYLKSRNLKVSVAACDTFRSGAVEQLKTHCRALQVRLFDQGYAPDAGRVAERAIMAAKKEGDDVVLVDTAGRMQNNAPLMKSLHSLIQLNKPDLTLFVGEALVGNDGVDQLMEFNKALAVRGSKHLIDGIILTKFDTVDDKVGAAISMTYKSRKPIVFIGTGQNYADLKRMHVSTLIKKLLQ